MDKFAENLGDKILQFDSQSVDRQCKLVNCKKGKYTSLLLNNFNLMTEEEHRLSELVKISPSLFFKECIAYSQKTGETLEICKYVQLSLLKNKGEIISESEELLFEYLSEKFRGVDTNPIQREYERKINIQDKKDIKQELKEIVTDVKDSVRNAHEKYPQRGYSGFLGFVNEVSRNIHEYLQYFNKRVNELGKNKMSTLNIIRNKIVYRVFAVVQRQTPYVDLLKFAA